MGFCKQEIERHLTVQGLTVETYPTVTSTNTLLKQRGNEGAPHGLVIAAETQIAGRGRMGRSFFSPSETGVYFSVLLRPQLSPADSLLITTAAAVACAEALEAVAQTRAEIKWVNDIYINNRKVCGILTEANYTGGEFLDYAVLGIGVNLTAPAEGWPEDIREKAGGVLHSTDVDLRCLVVAEILNRFFPLYETLTQRTFIPAYRSRSMLNGKAIRVIKPDGTYPATALEIGEDLSLTVQYHDGSIEHLTSGDVSIANR